MGDPGSEVFVRIPEGNGQFAVEVNSANAGTVVVGALSQIGAFTDDDYTVTFTQVLPTDPITYQVVGAASGVSGPDR